MSTDIEGGLDSWFASLRSELETTYLKHHEPWKQSGFSGSEERWLACRKPIADCIDKSGLFLDIGCANGFLLGCIMEWVGERGVSIIPYGIDLSDKLVALAKERLREYSDNFYVSNGLYWENPVKFDFVRTELVYVPDGLQKRYIDRILGSYLTDGGKLLLAEYRSRNTPLDKIWVDIKLSDWGFNISTQASGWFDNLELTRVSVIIK